jgi:U3 small nucleolar ribonucleoprotein protein IMP3
MVRKLKYHEQKLLKKVDFLQWKQERNSHEIKVMRRYHLQSREDYEKYNKIIGSIQKMATLLASLDINDPFRSKMTEQLMDKCYMMGLIPTKKGLHQMEHLTVSCLCRRRLPIIMVRLKMAETVREAVTFVEQGRKFKIPWL